MTDEQKYKKLKEEVESCGALKDYETRLEVTLMFSGMEDITMKHKVKLLRQALKFSKKKDNNEI